MSAEQELKERIIQKAWSDPDFKKQLLSDPKAALKEAFGLTLPSNIQLTVVEETPSSFHLIIPVAPAVNDDEINVQGTW